MATHSSILAWRIPYTEKPGGLQPMGSHRVGHDGTDLACTHMLRSPVDRDTKKHGKRSKEKWVV